MAIKRKTIISEDNLVALLKNKDNRGYSILYDNYSAALYGVISKIVKNEEIAQDTLQDVFVKIWKNIDAYDRSKGTIFTWMLNLARNTSIDMFRSQSYNRSQQNQDIDNVVNIVDSQQFSSFDIDTIGLKKLVEKLKPDSKFIIDLLFFQGYTQAEVAEEFKIPLGTVKTRSKAAIKQLRELFLSIMFIFSTLFIN
jgi:RNA polymerase sigma-70 factor, ECF subfamily